MFKNKYGIKSRNIELMYLTRLVGGLLFYLPISALYLEESLFSVTNVAIILAIQSISFALFEIPTGSIADLFGRKKINIY
ncbi:MFS transporter [Candidatus Woesearchaeota archaeon]|nr:MFS transporter [Candidatus Woesearchaeota archaeon]